MSDRHAAAIGTACAVLLTASCASPFEHDRQDGGPARASRQAASRIAQLDFGPAAHFALCQEPACPSVTRKTLPAAPNSAPVMQPASLDAAPAKPVATIPPASTTEHLIVHFASGATGLDAGARRLLDRLLPVARRAQRITIIGRTDSVGAARANDTLALARALEVRNYLRARMTTIDNRIDIEARGACCYVASNDTQLGRRDNRRVEVILTLRG